MSDQHKSINEFEFQLICNYFKEVERQGPGSPEMTKKAAGFLPNLPIDAKIADLGCGTGGQTRELAKAVPGTITGIDLFPGFIDLFNQKATEEGLENRVKGVVGSMDDLPFEEEELDLIWCEGAIYNIGYEKGLHDWRKYLKPGGFIAVTEATWFTNIRPAEIEDFWMESYPGIDTIVAKVDQMQKAGYLPVAHFILPEICWTEHFFAPQRPVQDSYLEKYADNVSACDLISNLKNEEKLYNKYKDYYGYVFYIGQKH